VLFTVPAATQDTDVAGEPAVPGPVWSARPVAGLVDTGGCWFRSLFRVTVACTCRCGRAIPAVRSSWTRTIRGLCSRWSAAVWRSRPPTVAEDGFGVEIVLLDGKEVRPNDPQNHVVVVYRENGK
jgi:hypothetical protein